MGSKRTSWISYLSFSAVCICSFWSQQGVVKSPSGHSIIRWGPLTWTLMSDFLSWKLLTLIERFGLSKLYQKSTLVPSKTQRLDKSYVILEENNMVISPSFHLPKQNWLDQYNNFNKHILQFNVHFLSL